MKYRNRIPEPGTTISGFADNEKKKKKKNNKDYFLIIFHTITDIIISKFSILYLKLKLLVVASQD